MTIAPEHYLPVPGNRDISIRNKLTGLFFRTDSSEEEVEEYEEGGDEEEHEGHLEYVGPNLMTSLEF